MTVARFFHPTRVKWWGEAIDDYFYLSGKKDKNFGVTLLKVASYFSLIIPLSAFIVKMVLAQQGDFFASAKQNFIDLTRERLARKNRRPIHIADLSSLGLNLKEEGSIEVETDGGDAICISSRNRRKVTVQETITVKMRQAIEEVIKAINTLPISYVNGKGSIQLCLSDPRWLCYHQLGAPSPILSPEDNKKRWLRKIIDALVEKRHLSALERVDEQGYHLIL